MNPYFELAFGQNTKISISEKKINIGNLPFSFKSFEGVTKTNDENIFFGMLNFEYKQYSISNTNLKFKTLKF